MAAISHVFTIRRAAQILGHDEDLLWQLSDQLEPEDGKLWVYDIDGAETPAFTHDGIEALREIIKDQIDRAWLISRRVYRGAQRMLTDDLALDSQFVSRAYRVRPAKFIEAGTDNAPCRLKLALNQEPHGE